MSLQRPNNQRIESKFIPKDEYFAIVKAMPIVTVDLILRNHDSEVLLGWRKSRPAKDSWFLPGGRVFKNEKIEEAFCRISQAELGLEAAFADARFQGVYELFFDSNFADVEGVGTHNISLAYLLPVGLQPVLGHIPRAQHSEYRWFKIKDLLDSSEVHPMAKSYFQSYDFGP